tara:strand:+ start:452 stop:604 length:153 start_codon:yes stop_codon:yes gene_type:complete
MNKDNKIVHLERIVESLLEHLEEHTYMNSVHNEIYRYNKREYLLMEEDDE